MTVAVRAGQDTAGAMSDARYATTDFRRFIADALAAAGHTRKELAKALDRSEAWLSVVLSGTRPLDPELVDRVATFLGLDPTGATYLAALVDTESASPRARRSAWATIQATQRQLASTGLAREVALAYSRWYMPAILELALCEGFQADPAWIARTLNPQIDEGKAAEALTTLVRLELLVPNAEGRLGRAAPDGWSPPELPPGDISEAIAALHTDMLGLATASVRGARFNERHLSSTVIAMREDRYEHVVARLRELERELAVLAAEGEQPPNRVYHLGVQLFPLSAFTDP